MDAMMHSQVAQAARAVTETRGSQMVVQYEQHVRRPPPSLLSIDMTHLIVPDRSSYRY